MPVRRAPIARLAALLVGVPLLVTALAIPRAAAVDVQSEAAVVSAKSLADYLSDLEGSSDPDRLFAARVLLGQLKRALRTEAHARPDSLALLDAQALLLELGERLPRACGTAIRYANAVSPCADIFARLEETSALPALRTALAGETRRGPRKHLERAIEALERIAPPTAPLPALPPPQPAPPAPLPSPGPPPLLPPTPASPP